MKKRLFVLLFVLALAVCALCMTATAADTLSYKCEHCDKVVQWEPVVFGTHEIAAGAAPVHKHFYLDKDYSGTAVKQLYIKQGVTLCLDLHGQNIVSSQRVIYPGTGGVTVSVMDSVGTGSITVNTYATGNNIAGGIAYVDTDGTLNIYGGTYTLGDNTSQRTKTGGVIAVQNRAVCNLYGGTINGGAVSTSGGTGGAVHVYAGGHLKVYDAVINAGTAPTGGCVYAAGSASKVTLSAGADVDEVFCAYNGPCLIVEGPYTGTANVKYNVSVNEGTTVGTCTGSIGQNLRCTNGDGYYIVANGSSLLLSAYLPGTVAGVKTDAGTQSFDSLQAAIDACEGGCVELITDTAENVTVNKDVVLALNGNSVTGTVTVSDGCTLYGMDNKTDDYTVADGDYGKLTKVVCEGTGKVTGLSAESKFAEDGYLKVTETTGVSFHRVNLQIYAMTLRAEEAGVYYKSNFAGDELVASNVAKFGIALNANTAPNADNMETTSQYSWFTGFKSGEVANRGNSTSTLLKDILTTENSKLINRRNADQKVHGRAYILTKDGEYVFGQNTARNLMEQLEGVDAIWSELSQVQTGKVLDMYSTFSYMMKTWNLPNIQQENQKAEDAVLKVIVLGNSHGLDATNLLYEVFQDQNPDQKVMLGALYYSGCNVTQHRNFITANDPVYSYHKNYGQNEDGSWDVVYNATVLTALEDEQWDIIVMQQMNHRAGMDTAEWGSYRADDWQFVIDYLKEHQDYEPRLAFHMVWANPDNYADYLDDDAPYNNPSPVDWRNTHERYFAGADGKYDMGVLFDSIISCTQKYLVDTTAFLGENYYEFIIPSATAVQYAQDVLGCTQADIYRDYTHMNDYGRLMVAYVWYAKIMGIDKIENVGIDAIPTVLHHSNSLYPSAGSGYAITEDMKADIIEAVNWALENPFALPEE